MKKHFDTICGLRTFFALTLCVVLSLGMFSCGSDDEDETDNLGDLLASGSGSFQYGNESFNMLGGAQLFYGKEEYNTETNNIDLVLAGDKYMLYCVFFVPASKDKLVTGIYRFDDDGSFCTCLGAGLFDADGNKVADLTGGLITIGETNGKYMVNVDCTSTGGYVKGKYEGGLKWHDDR